MIVLTTKYLILQCDARAGSHASSGRVSTIINLTRSRLIYHPHSSSSSKVCAASAPSTSLLPELIFACGDRGALTWTGIITSPNPPHATTSVSSSSSNDTEDDDWSGVAEPDAEVEEDGAGEDHESEAKAGLYDADARGGDDNADAMVWDMSERSREALFWPLENVGPR